jgi:hypothetical protein
MNDINKKNHGIPFTAAALGEPDAVMNHWSILGWALVYVLVAGLIQYFTSYPYDVDTAYHAAVGSLIRAHGVLRAFPWTTFSWLADHYADKELLFHLLFVPLAGISWITSAKIVGTLGGATLLTVLYLLLRLERIRFAGIWALLPLAASAVFIVRFSFVRPHLFSIALSLVVLWAAVRNRLAYLALASAIYPWIYVAFWQLSLLLLLAAETGRFLSEKRIFWKPAVAVLCGMAVGLLFHPYSVNLLKLNWIHMVNVLFRAWGGNEVAILGDEIRPFTIFQWVHWLVVYVVIIIIACITAWRNRHSDVMLVAFTVAALGFGFLMYQSQRFVEYFGPFSVAALALSSRWMRWKYVAIVALIISTTYTIVAGSDTVATLTKQEETLSTDAASFLRREIPQSAQVFTCDWAFTGVLMLALPDRKFMVALEPTLFYMKDPELYRLWYRLPRENLPGARNIIRQKFGARYVLSLWNDNWKPFYYQLSSEPGVKTVILQEKWMFFDLGGLSSQSNATEEH